MPHHGHVAPLIYSSSRKTAPVPKAAPVPPAQLAAAAKVYAELYAEAVTTDISNAIKAGTVPYRKLTYMDGNDQLQQVKAARIVIAGGAYGRAAQVDPNLMKWWDENHEGVAEALDAAAAKRLESLGFEVVSVMDRQCIVRDPKWIAQYGEDFFERGGK